MKVVDLMFSYNEERMMSMENRSCHSPIFPAIAHMLFPNPHQTFLRFCCCWWEWFDKNELKSYNQVTKLTYKFGFKPLFERMIP